MFWNRSNSTKKRWGLYYAVLFAWLATTAMHIPDGYLSPITSLIMFLLVLPFWVIGVRKIRQTMNARSVPLIALLAAFSFVIMMFNVPLPGGTTGHAVGAALAAIILGPEVATIAVSIALIIQAFFFGDGGILAIGANCFNMAVVIPYVSYAIYRTFSKGARVTSSRRLVGAAVGGWVGVTIGAFVTGIEFGLQPLLFKTADGTPLYAPYPLSVAIPAMVIPHMLVASVVEGLLTALVVAYMQRTYPVIFGATEKPGEVFVESTFHKLRWLWIGLGTLILASPLGLLAPGTAWGEWGTRELSNMGLKNIPTGLERLSGLWGAPLAGYNLTALGNASFGYILSAILGITVIVLVVVLSARLINVIPSIAAQSARRRRNVLENTIHGISETLERGLFAEEISGRPGFFQSLDARMKVISILALLIGVSFSRNLWVIGSVYLLALIFAWRSAIPADYFIKRVWLTLPFFTGLVALPALFITPGPTLVQLPLGLVITSTGLMTALFLLLRVSTSVSLTLLLILTTPWNTILSALGILHIPDVFILILGMTYRYIYLLLHAANDMFLSRQSRVVGRLSSTEGRRMIAATSATLLSKSFDLSGEVYLAMQSRGFRGTAVTLKPFSMKARDWGWLIFFISIALAAILLGR